MLLLQAEKEIGLLTQNCMFKQKINLDRHSPEPYPNIWHFPDPPIFSLPTTFNAEDPFFRCRLIIPNSLKN